MGVGWGEHPPSPRPVSLLRSQLQAEAASNLQWMGAISSLMILWSPRVTFLGHVLPQRRQNSCPSQESAWRSPPLPSPSFRAAFLDSQPPSTSDNLRRYLASIVFKSIDGGGTKNLLCSQSGIPVSGSDCIRDKFPFGAGINHPDSIVSLFSQAERARGFLR